MNLQTHYDLEAARDKEKGKIEQEVRPIAVEA
jgi:plasmid maintenance system antidote protein VapI